MMEDDYLRQLAECWEETSSFPPWFFLSVPEINCYFKRKIEKIKEQSPLFRYVHNNNYYVVVLDQHQDQEEFLLARKAILVSGEYLRTFSVKIPTLTVLRQQVIDKGIPRSDRKAFSVELDALVFSCARRADKSIESVY